MGDVIGTQKPAAVRPGDGRTLRGQRITANRPAVGNVLRRGGPRGSRTQARRTHQAVRPYARYPAASPRRSSPRPWRVVSSLSGPNRKPYGRSATTEEKQVAKASARRLAHVNIAAQDLGTTSPLSYQRQRPTRTAAITRCPRPDAKVTLHPFAIIDNGEGREGARHHHRLDLSRRVTTGIGLLARTARHARLHTSMKHAPRRGSTGRCCSGRGPPLTALCRRHRARAARPPVACPTHGGAEQGGHGRDEEILELVELRSASCSPITRSP